MLSEVPVNTKEGLSVSKSKKKNSLYNPPTPNVNNQIYVPKKEINLIPKNISQKNLLGLLNDNNKNIVCAVGPAGTGKTYLSVLWALSKFEEGEFKKIVISRPNIAVDDNDIGFLPGTMFEKMAPWILPILDIFKEHYTLQYIEQLIKKELIEIVPISHIRGRTFKNSVILIDEAQGTTINSMLSILTRIGENSKMIITGDTKQTDRINSNGLQDLMNKLEAVDNPRKSLIGLIKFKTIDVERHNAVQEVLKLYEQN